MADVAPPRQPTFGQQLKARRKALGLSQLDIALRIGCAEATIQKIESGARRASRQVAQLLAEALSVAPEQREAFITAARTGAPLPSAASHAEPHRPSPPALPVLLTPLLGRDAELAAVHDRLLRDTVRMVTLVGAPGIGKTSLAIAVANSLEGAGAFADGVFFVPLAPVNNPDAVLSSIAQALGLKDAGPEPAEAGLPAYLAGKHALLVLDNFEHLLEAATRVVNLLQHSPGLKMLITSRAALNVRVEQQVLLSPLSLPDLKALPAVEAIAAYASVQLFVDRARAADPDFAITSHNATAVAEICVRLDGLPLAIELVAARARLLPPQALLARLAPRGYPRLALLTGGPRDLPARHQTLRDAIGWSYDLLDDRERALFRRLAVFVGGCTLAAAEAICNARADLPEGLLEPMGSLLDKSLLRQEAGAEDEPRFTMLETVREYAMERLEETPEAESIRQYHIEYYIALAESAEPQLSSAQSKLWLDKLEREHDNVRAALAWAEQSDAVRGPRLAGAIVRFWAVGGHYREGREWLARLLRQLGTAGNVEARGILLSGAGYLSYDQGDLISAQHYFEESLRLYRELDIGSGIAHALNGLGIVSQERGSTEAPEGRALGEARRYHEESLAIRKALGDKRGTLQSLNNLAAVLMDTDEAEIDRARAIFEESLALSSEVDSRSSRAWALSGLGEIARLEGDYGEARRFHEESLAVHRQSGDNWSIAVQLNHLGLVAFRQGDIEQAEGCYAESLSISRERKQLADMARSLKGLSLVAESRGDASRAASLFGAGEALLETLRGTSHSGMNSEAEDLAARIARHLE